jgi:hypothetical protein
MVLNTNAKLGEGGKVKTVIPSKFTQWITLAGLAPSQVARGLGDSIESRGNLIEKRKFPSPQSHHIYGVNIDGQTN